VHEHDRAENSLSCQYLRHDSGRNASCCLCLVHWVQSSTSNRPNYKLYNSDPYSKWRSKLT